MVKHFTWRTEGGSTASLWMRTANGCWQLPSDWALTHPMTRLTMQRWKTFLSGSSYEICSSSFSIFLISSSACRRRGEEETGEEGEVDKHRGVRRSLNLQQRWRRVWKNKRVAVQYLLVLSGHDVGHTQVGQDHGAHIQDLKTHTHRLNWRC